MSVPAILALDPGLDASMRSEACGDIIPLPLRRFADVWKASRTTSAMQGATEQLLDLYWKHFNVASPVIRVSWLCELLGIKLTGLRPSGRARSDYTGPESSTRHEGHSGAVRFCPGGAPTIKIPDHVDGHRARIATAHEIGHVLIHKRDNKYDEVTTRLPTSSHEEALAEYAARLLLLPKRSRLQNLAESALQWASEAQVSVHAATCRMGDPDQIPSAIRGAVLWKVNRRLSPSLPTHERLTPAWHLCPGAFVPIGKCKARDTSLASELARGGPWVSGIATEDVHIGSFAGSFTVHATAWGSLPAGTRLVLTVFEEKTDSDTDSKPESMSSSEQSALW